MKNSKRFCVQIVAICSLWSLTVTAFAADKKDVVRQARQSYYSLRDQGLSQFQCSIAPNWEALLAKERASDPAAAAAAVKKLNEIHFQMSLLPDGSVKITHNEVTGPNEQTNKGLAQVFSGMEQMVNGFFETWSLFMLTHPWPPVESDYQLEEQGPQHHLTYKEGTADVSTTFSKDFAISDMSVTTPQFKSRLQPQFTGSPKGFLLSAYQGDYTSSNPGEATQVQVRIGYQTVDGLQLPQKLNIGGTYGGSAFQIEVAFTGCHADKK